MNRLLRTLRGHLLKKSQKVVGDTATSKNIFIPIRLLGKQGSFPTARFTPGMNEGGRLQISHRSFISHGLQYTYTSFSAVKLCVIKGSDRSSTGSEKS